jgi:hypothetical protein
MPERVSGFLQAGNYMVQSLIVCFQQMKMIQIQRTKYSNDKYGSVLPYDGHWVTTAISQMSKRISLANIETITCNYTNDEWDNR